MRKALPLTALVLFALLAVAGSFVARYNRAELVTANLDVLCGPSFCAQLAGYRTGATPPAPRPGRVVGGS